MTQEGERVTLYLSDNETQENIKKRRVGAIFYHDDKPRKHITTEKIYAEDTKLPFVLLKNGMGELRQRDDMQWGIMDGDIHRHTLRNFNLSDKIKVPAVVQAIKNDVSIPKEELVGRFERLAQLTSGSEMLTNNLNLVRHFVSNNDVEGDKGDFSDPILTSHAFNHKNTREFVASVQSAFKDRLKNAKGVLRKVDITRDGIRSPDFNLLRDHFQGLMFAVHHLQAFSVEVTEYAYDRKYRQFDATIEITLYDHFGMDFGDVQKFGTVSAIMGQRKAIVASVAGTAALTSASVATAGAAIGADSSETKRDLAIASAVTGAASVASGAVHSQLFPASDGFRAWFILQHFFGCKPFVTVMKQTITFKREQL